MLLIELLTLSVQRNASDLHLSPGLIPIVRVNGELIYLDNQPVIDANVIKTMLYSYLNKKQIQDLESNLEIDFAIELDDGYRFRANVFYQINGIAAVFRIIPKRVPTLDELDMPPIIKKILSSSNGIILVTGPTGSGKSTTLAAMIDHININQACHIITIEDPIEFTYQSKKSLISQRQVSRDTHHFTTALRSALREDPNIIVVGEMRDIETIRLALTAAETGHLVLATLHTSSAPRSISRIIDVFPAREKNVIKNILSESIQAVISQRLIKKVNGERIAAFEIMVATNAIRHLIREDKIAQIYSSIQTGSAYGMCTLDQYLKNLEIKQIITSTALQENAVKNEY